MVVFLKDAIDFLCYNEVILVTRKIFRRFFMKKIMTMLLVTCMVASLLAGCKANSTQKPVTNPVTEENATTDEGATQSPTTAASAEAGDVTLPLADGASLSLWCSIDTTTANNITDYSETPASKELEKRTGVHIEYSHPSSTTQQEQFNLLIASGNLPDIMWYSTNSAYYTGGLDAMVTDGNFLDLNDYKEYMPNYFAAINRNEETKRQCYTDEGRMAVAWMLNIEKEWDWGGPLIRQDWLQECGLEVPKTYDDWTTMLTAFKEKYGAKAPVLTGSKTLFNMLDDINAGFGVSDDFYNVDGVVTYGPIQEGYKKFLTLMNEWYEKGLLDPEFMTRDTADLTTLANGQTGALLFGIWTQPTAYKAQYKVDLVPAPYPSIDGSTTHLGWQQYEITSEAVGITTSCKDPILAAKWIDYLYSEEGSILRNYGVEGVSYEYIEGVPQFTQEVRDKKATGNYSNYDWTGICQGIGIYDWKNSLYGNDEKNLSCYDVWDASTDGSYTMPPITLTADEGTKFSTQMGDIKTYAEECTLKFVTGSMDINTEWDAYVEQMKSMGVDKATALKQAALDRYNAR
jgi:putative aldouronate transport system substrate-binding protein